jgi:hypothetical protein
MEIARQDSDKYARDTGRSLTVLRRQLANSQAIKTPNWAVDVPSVAALVPFMLIGAWDSRNAKDAAAVAQLSKAKSDDDIEREVAHLVTLDDAPMWSAGSMRGVVSKLDLLHLVAPAITKYDLQGYYKLAASVLGEDNPAVDLEESEQPFASLFGKVREYSSTLRLGIAETLVLLAAHGNTLFRDRPRVDTEREAAQLVERLLPYPLTERSLLSHERDLRTYAEAAPDRFLDILEHDLATSNPVTITWMNKSSPGVFGGSPARTGLLWALEALCWSPDTLLRAARVLARLAQVKIVDRWTNKPMNSLLSVLHKAFPQTAATVEQRISVLKDLEATRPDIAWQLALQAIGDRMEMIREGCRPRWRTDAAGCGGVGTAEAAEQFESAAIELVLGRSSHSRATLDDLVEHVAMLRPAQQVQVWHLIETWARAGASDEDLAKLRETVRVRALSMRARRLAKDTHISDAARRAYILLEPKSLLLKHAWLFREPRLEESYDEAYVDTEHDYVERGKRIQALRFNALQEVYTAQSLAGIIDLGMCGNATREVGHLCARRLLTSDENVALIQEIFELDNATRDDSSRLKSLASGILWSLDEDPLDSVLGQLKTRLAEVIFTIVLQQAPFNSRTWKFVDALKSQAQEQYWQNVVPQRYFDVDSTEAVLRLLEAGRPKAALSIVDTQQRTTDIRTLYRLLCDIVKEGKEKQTEYPVEAYAVEQIFKWIDSSTEFTLQEKALLEFRYLNILAPSLTKSDNPGAPNLEKFLEAQPALFVQAVVWSYKRSDENVDPAEYAIKPEDCERLANHGQSFFHGVRRVPFSSGENFEHLFEWVKCVREECARLARTDVADLKLGELLANAPIGKDDVWPCEAVRDVLESVRSDRLMQGFVVGVHNSRGVFTREYEEGGKQEDELAAKYRRWAEALQFSHPYVATRLLDEIVDDYHQDARRADTEVDVRRRLGH